MNVVLDILYEVEKDVLTSLARILPAAVGTETGVLSINEGNGDRVGKIAEVLLHGFHRPYILVVAEDGEGRLSTKTT